MQGLDVVGPVILEQELVKDRNRRVYIIKQYKQREKKLIHVSIRHMRENGSVECDVMPVASAIMWFGTSMPTMKVIYSKATRYYGDDAVRLPT